MEPFVKPQTLQGYLCFMRTECIRMLKEDGLLLDCRACGNSYLKPSPAPITQCVCGNVVDQSREAWAMPDYTPPQGGVIPTIPVILSKFYRLGGDKADEVARLLGVSRSALYRAMAGQSRLKQTAMAVLADLCASKGWQDDANAISGYWMRRKDPYNLGAPRITTMEDMGLTSGYWEKRMQDQANQRNGFSPNPAFFPPGTYLGSKP